MTAFQSRRRPLLLALVLLTALGLGHCDDDPPPPEDAGPDGDADSGGDGSTDGDVDGGGPTHQARVLVLDQELRHHSTWTDVLDAFERAGLEPQYRRFYPHLTLSDVTADEATGLTPYSVVVLAAGRTPGNPGSVMRLAELENARRFVEGGGALVLVTQSGYRDSWSGENDWFIFNRLLETMDVPVRIDRNTVVAEVWYDEPTPPHLNSYWAYATPLEFTIGYPYFMPPGPRETETQVAGGMSPTLRVGADDVQVLLRTHDLGYLWLNNGGDPDLRIDYCDDFFAVAALAAVDAGHVAVVPRGVFTLTAASSISDKPAYDPGRREVNLEWIRGLAQQLNDLVQGDAELEVTESRDNDTLFSAGASGILPLDPSGEIYTIAVRVSTASVPDTPPEGELDEVIPPVPDSPRPIPEWFSPGGGRLAYANLPARDAMATAFAEVVDHDIDILMTTTNPVRLTTLTGDDLAAEEAMYAELAALAETAGARWFIGEHYVGPYLGAPTGTYADMAGGHGGPGDAPAPLNAAYWEEVLLPTCEAVGRVAADNPGIAGYHLDLELYSGPVWHHDGWAFSNDTVEAFAALSADDELDEELLGTRTGARLDFLVDRGALGTYFATLEQAAFEYARRCRDAIQDDAPQVDLMVYVAAFPNTWFYRGLLRGFGHDDRPAIALTYDGWDNAASDALWADGLPMVHLGGTIVSHFPPSIFEEVLLSLAAGNDGYWYFTFNDFSATTAEHPPLHGDPTEYWDALDAANARLE